MNRYLPHRTGTFLKKSYQIHRNGGKQPEPKNDEDVHVFNESQPQPAQSQPQQPQPQLMNQAHFMPVNDIQQQQQQRNFHYGFNNPFNNQPTIQPPPPHQQQQQQQPLFTAMSTQFMDPSKEDIIILQDISIGSILNNNHQDEAESSIVFEEEDLDSDVDDDFDDLANGIDWSQEEDREILRASIEMGNNMNHLQIWEHLYNSKTINKEPVLIGARYAELVRLFTSMHKR
jgi:hypothetical protein